MFKNVYFKFKLGEEFDEMILDGCKCKVSNEKIKMYLSMLISISFWWNSYKIKFFLRICYFVFVYMFRIWVFKFF